jgi:hypothetical protein
MEIDGRLWRIKQNSRMQVKHTKKDIGIHKSPPINTKITEDRKLSQINRKREPEQEKTDDAFPSTDSSNADLNFCAL